MANTSLTVKDSNESVFLKAKLFLGIALLLLFLWHSLNIILLIFCAVLIAVLLRAAANKIYRYTPLSHGISITIVIVFIILLFSALITIATPIIAEQMQIFTESIPSGYSKIKQQFNQFGWSQELLGSLDLSRDRLIGFFTDKDFLSQLTGVFTTTFDVITALIITLLMAIYLASDPNLYVNGLIRLIPIAHRERTSEVFKQAYTALKGWFFAQLLAMILLGILVTAGLVLLDVPLPFTLGIFAGFMTIIPNFGPFIYGIPTVLLAFSVDPMTGVYALIFIIIVQNLEGSFITPMIQKKMISLPPALIILAQVLLASFYGFVGLLVAMPLLVVVIVFVKSFYIEDILEKSTDIEILNNYSS